MPNSIITIIRLRERRRSKMPSLAAGRGKTVAHPQIGPPLNQPRPLVNSRAVTSKALTRGLWVAVLVALLGLTSPRIGFAHSTPARKHQCCARMQMPVHNNHCGEHPAKAPQCCGGCAVGLSLYSTAPARFIFPHTAGENFAADVFSEVSRVERPAIPPPRA